MTEILVPDHAAIEESTWLDLPASRKFGDIWVREQRSLLLRVPSIAADKMEFNFVINPNHADFTEIKQGTSRPFHFDERFVHFP
jgi:RES domain-containing protein